MPGSSRSALWVALALGLMLMLAFGVALLMGEYDLGLDTVFAVLASKLGLGADGVAHAFSRMQEIVIWRIRLPRLVMAVLTGMALAASGAVYQGCFRNPLVEPYILGVSAGAAFGAAMGIVWPWLFPLVQVPAFLAALTAVGCATFLARSHGETPPVTLILSGIIVSAICTALVGIMKYLAADAELREITFWMMGGLYYATWHDVLITACAVLPGLAVLVALAWKLNILSLGDEEARSLGVHPERLRLVFIVISTLVASVCVSAVGIIAWVGLMMPHAARMLFGPDNRWVIPCSAVLGAIYLLVCDTIARTLTGAEIPLAIVTSIVGAPYLLWLLRARGRDLYAG